MQKDNSILVFYFFLIYFITFVRLYLYNNACRKGKVTHSDKMGKKAVTNFIVR